MRPSDDTVRTPLVDRLRGAFLKPTEPSAKQTPTATQSVDELESGIKANDKERLIGLVAAPFAAAIGLLITDALISHDPPTHLSSGAVNKLHVSVSLYHEVMIALVVLALVMLATAWLRKRLYLGIVMALYGLTVFNLHYWGFGIPYLLCAGWLIVRAYRAQKSLRDATGGATSPKGPGRRTAYAAARPRASRRYTPPASGLRS